MNCSLFLTLSYFLSIYFRLVAALSSGNMMDEHSKDCPANPRNQRPPTPNVVEVILSEEEVELVHGDSFSVASTTPSPIDPHRCTLPDMNDESIFEPESEDTSVDEYEYFPELHEPRQHVPLPEMSVPRFEESSYSMGDIPIIRPYCPVPNDQMFMPPHEFNPQMFPPPTYEPYDFTPNVTRVQYLDRPFPDSSSMPHHFRPIHQEPNTQYSHYGLNYMHQQQNVHYTAPQPVFDINEPGPSHIRNNPVPNGLPRMPPSIPLSVDVLRTIDLTIQLMSDLREELGKITNIFSSVASAVERRSSAPTRKTIGTRCNPFGPATGKLPNMECPHPNCSDFGPTKAKQLKTRQTAVKTSKPKASKEEQPPAAEANIALLTIAPPTVEPVSGKSSNLTLAILKPSMRTYHGRRDEITQPNPPRYHSFAGCFPRRSTPDSDDELDENDNIINPKPNRKRRHSESK